MPFEGDGFYLANTNIFRIHLFTQELAVFEFILMTKKLSKDNTLEEVVYSLVGNNIEELIEKEKEYLIIIL